jgi:hypothetical protein
MAGENQDTMSRKYKVRDKEGQSLLEQKKQLKYFDPTTMPDACNVLVVGMTGSGKSTVVTSLLRWKTDTLLKGICICPTEGVNGYWSRFIPPPLIHTKPDPRLVQSLFDLQLEAPSVEDEMGKKSPRDAVFAIFDDCLQNDYFMHSTEVEELLLTGRHYKIFSVFTAQYAMAVPKILRQNFRYVILLPTTDKKELHGWYEEFGTIFPSFERFEEAFYSISKMRGCLVIHRQGDPELQATWFQPDPEIRYKMGSKAYWSFSDLGSDVNSHEVKEMMRNPEMQVMLLPPPEPLKNGKGKGKNGEKPGKPRIFARDRKMISPNVALYESKFLKYMGDRGARPNQNPNPNPPVHVVDSDDEYSEED